MKSDITGMTAVVNEAFIAWKLPFDGEKVTLLIGKEGGTFLVGEMNKYLAVVLDSPFISRVSHKGLGKEGQ